MKRTLLFFCALGWVCRALAVVASPHPINYPCADGTVVRLWLQGDEYESYYITDDSVRVRPDWKGHLLPDNTPRRKVSSGRAKAPQLRSGFPRTGKVKSLVLLVNFSDVKFVTPSPNKAFTDLLNQKDYSMNGGHGSAADYFTASSFGVFLPEFVVLGPYDLPHTQAYYGDTWPHNDGAAKMVVDACNLARDNGVNFADYDLNNDGVVDNVFIYYAGHNEAEGGGDHTIWPHRSVVINSPNYGGKVVYDYACTSELRDNVGSDMCGIGTFCHEFGHVLGLPDLYDTGNSSRYTVGTWDIMCSGSYNNEGRTPPLYTAFERFMLGWLEPIPLTAVDADYVLEPLETSNQAYLLSAKSHNLNPDSPNPAEYFLLENRQRVGMDEPLVKYDNDGEPVAALPGTGLLVTHITFNSSNYSRNTFNNFSPLGFAVEEANAFPSQTRSLQSDTYPGTLGVSLFIPQLNDGTQLIEQQVARIVQNDDLSVSFHYGIPSGTGFVFSPSAIPQLVTSYNGRPVEYQTGKLSVSATGLKGDSVFITLSNDRFQINVEGSWVYGYAAPIAADSTFSCDFLIRHTPVRMCTSSSALLKVRTDSDSHFNQINLSGFAPRPNYLDTVQMFSPADITPYSFVAHWQPQADAELYYLTLYSLRDEPSQTVEGFEDFLSLAGIREKGWTASFVGLTTDEYKDGGAALLFSATGDSVVSPTSLVPLAGLSFWLSNTYRASLGNEQPEGVLLVEAVSDEGNWKKVDSIVVGPLTRRIEKHYTFSPDDVFSRVRLSYTHLRGEGGAVVDAFTLLSDRTVDYVYQDRDYPIYAPDTSVTVNGLSSGTYYCFVRAFESKGCEDHYGPVPAPISFLLPFSFGDPSKQFTVQKYSETVLRAYLPTKPDTERKIYVYTPAGLLLWVADVNPDEFYVDLPASLFVRGEVYFAKYSGKRMSRKDLWAKFVY